MTDTRVLQISRSDDPLEKVLLHVSIDNNTNDLTLTATEGSEGYRRTVPRRQLDDCRDAKSRVSSSEWRDAVDWLLLHRLPPSQDASSFSNIELVATVAPQDKITLVVRQNIGGITTRKGSIPIGSDEDAAIELFDWNVLAILSRDTVESQVTALQAQHNEQQRKLEALKKQLDEIIEAKKRHEDEMLEKFRHLLNAKKSKIRDQMRLLATVKVDGATARSVRSSRGSDQAVNGASKKRRLKRRGAIDEDEDLEDEEEPKMADEEPDTDPDARRTPEPETEDETDEDTSLTSAPPPTRNHKAPMTSTQSQVKLESQSQRGSRTTKPKSKQQNNDSDSSDSGFEVASQKTTTRSSKRETQNTSSQTERQSQQAQKSTEVSSPPPPRVLPFKNSAAKSAPASQESRQSKKASNGAPEDDTTDDDEL